MPSGLSKKTNLFSSTNEFKIAVDGYRKIPQTWT